MIRLLVRTLVAVVANAVGLLVAAARVVSSTIERMTRRLTDGALRQ